MQSCSGPLEEADQGNTWQLLSQDVRLGAGIILGRCIPRSSLAVVALLLSWKKKEGEEEEDVQTRARTVPRYHCLHRCHLLLVDTQLSQPQPMTFSLPVVLDDPELVDSFRGSGNWIWLVHPPFHLKKGAQIPERNEINENIRVQFGFGIIDAFPCLFLSSSRSRGWVCFRSWWRAG